MIFLKEGRHRVAILGMRNPKIPYPISMLPLPLLVEKWGVRDECGSNFPGGIQDPGACEWHASTHRPPSTGTSTWEGR